MIKFQGKVIHSIDLKTKLHIYILTVLYSLKHTQTHTHLWLFSKFSCSGVPNGVHVQDLNLLEERNILVSSGDLREEWDSARMVAAV